MGRKSTFSQMPEELTKKFHGLLSHEKYTQKQIRDYLNEYLAQIGEEPVITEKIVQRQAKNYKERLAVAGEKLRRERELAESMMQQIGMKPNTAQSQLLSALLQSMTMRVGMDMDEGEELPSPKDLKDLAQAKKITDESNRITEQLIRQAEQKATEKVITTAKANGVSEENIIKIRRDLLGMES